MLTTDPNDPDIKRGGADVEPGPQNEKYLVLSDEELAKGFVRPVRRTYLHVGPLGPKYALRELTAEEARDFAEEKYVGFEVYPESAAPLVGRFWTQAELDKVGRGCGFATTMDLKIAETYARSPGFYGSTYCMGCQRHLAVGEFTWEDGTTRVGS